MFSKSLPILFLVVSSFALTGPAVADPDSWAKRIGAPRVREPGMQFIRVARENKKVLSLDTAIVSYVGRNAGGKEVRVDLIGAVHVGEKSYYHELNKAFDKCEVVLYELVAPKGLRPSRGEAGVWNPLAKFLNLADQVAEIDYTKKHFVHADMTGGELLEAMKKRDEHVLKLVGRAIGAGIAQQSGGGTSDAEIFAALFFARDKSMALKQVFAQQFENPETAMSWMEGPDGSALITDRNNVALQVLEEQLKAGKRHIGIFYGAGHLAHMESRLLEDFAMKRGEQRWLVAWNLTETTAKKAKAPKR